MSPYLQYTVATFVLVVLLLIVAVRHIWKY